MADKITICNCNGIDGCNTGSMEGYMGPINDAGLRLIKEFEGFREDFYQDPKNITTIGYGHACHVFDCSVPINGLYTPPLTQKEGHHLLQSDLITPRRYELCVQDVVTWPSLNTDQYSALVSFTFNLGCNTLKTSTLLRMLNSGNILEASEEFGRFVNSDGVVLPGLVRRREAERLLFCQSGQCPTGCTGNVKIASLTIRKEPTNSSPAIYVLKQGDHVDIYSRIEGEIISGTEYWFKISSGFISAAYVSLVEMNQAWCVQ